jgi:hypothetical protein
VPTTYLPTIVERYICVVQLTESKWVLHEFTTTASCVSQYLGARHIGAFRPDSIIETWKSDLIRLGDRRAKWEFVQSTESTATALIVTATAVPAHLTRSDRVDLLLSHIFQLSCRAAMQGRRDRVASLDDRYAAVEHAYYGTTGDADRIAAAKRIRLSTALAG